MGRHQGEVYFAASEGRIKIGTTTYAVVDRLTQISAHLPTPLTLIATLSGGLALERAIQRHFCDYQIKGEWFRDCVELRQAIADLIERGPTAIGFVAPRVPAGLIRGDLEAKCAEQRDENISKLIRRMWPEQSAQGMASYLSLSPRLCQVFIDRKASAPRVVRLALFAAFMVWQKRQSPPERSAA